MKKLIFFSIMSWVVGCQNKQEEADATAYYTTTNTVIKKAIQHTNFSLDSLKIRVDETSYTGHFDVYNDTLYFIDERFDYIFSFDKNGTPISKHIGKGGGPNEVLGISGITMGAKDFITYNDKNSSVDVFSKRFEKLRSLRMDWQIRRSYEEVLNNPQPSIGDTYEFDYGIPNILKKWDKEHVAIAITASHPKFNGYFNSDIYYNYSRILAIINLQTGKIEQLIGRRSPIYLKYKNIPNFDHFNYDTTEDIDEVYLNFWADPAIYIYSKKEDKIVGKFGLAGLDMNTNYRQTNTFDEAEENRREDERIYGYYTFIKYLPQLGSVVRGYSKGEGTTSDGLQLYQKQQLIADIEVPKGLQLIGAIGGVYYATTPQDMDRDYLTIYKFSFN
ncbi:hypothetical protein [Capnocytophaga sp. oral taxon 878]|uniref:hypothetical protein n=1 Tax=Capnocytophaga sp. oral taxon 878 TaxID=1316596 RepID=UPI000D0470BC|nr:hypothetical protein [Capnocytophaga sp. oral taxon 878]AVM50613.1 hypothetical protein C4H12_09085 [Capnocytophaga sp. oral taxon 878]